MNVPPDTPITIANLRALLQQGWDRLWGYLNTLTPDQLTRKTDAAGWSIKDHVMHMAVWEVGIAALLERPPHETREQAMGFDAKMWDLDFDEQNEQIQQRYKDLSWDEMKTRFEAIHARLLKSIEPLNDADLMLPYSHYAPGSDESRPVIEFINGNTFEHYEEHIPWMQAIAAS